jgi:hypothetical protein
MTQDGPHSLHVSAQPVGALRTVHTAGFRVVGTRWPVRHDF